MMTLTQTDLDAFLDGYVTAALWTTSIEEDHAARHNAATGEDRGPDASMLDIGMTVEDIDPDTLAKLRAHCVAFMETNAPDLAKYRETRSYDPTDGSVMEHAGHDYWLTRNGHGCGFWSRDLGELGDRLTSAAGLSEVDLYVGDDGKVYA